MKGRYIEDGISPVPLPASWQSADGKYLWEGVAMVTTLMIYCNYNKF